MSLLLRKLTQALTLAICIRELLSLNLARDTDDSVLNSSLLSLVCPEECWDSALS
jgi:hypothetical protein